MYVAQHKLRWYSVIRAPERMTAAEVQIMQVLIISRTRSCS